MHITLVNLLLFNNFLRNERIKFHKQREIDGGRYKPTNNLTAKKMTHYAPGPRLGRTLS